MRAPYLWIAIAAVLAAVFFISWPAFSQVVDSQPAIAPSSVWFDAWQIVQPLVVMLVSTVGPVLVTWIAARLISFLKLSGDAKKTEIEAGLRDALHKSALNGLKYAMAKTGVPPGVVGNLVLSEAAAYVQQKNPGTLNKLGVSDEALQQIIMSKVPDLAAMSWKS